MPKEYRVMHGERHIASVTPQGKAVVHDASFLPFDLYLEEGNDVDIRVNNLTCFYHWCATRLLLLERTYAKEMLNSVGVTQSATDSDRARVALSYHCLTLTDIYWVKQAEETVSFAEINLYEKPCDNALADIALKGTQTSVADAHLIARDISTDGLCPKAWVQRNGTFYLLKDGEAESVANELLASRICSCFDVPAVRYEEDIYEGLTVSCAKLITGMDVSIVSREAFEIYAKNHELDSEAFILSLDAHGYYMMNIIDYLVGNTDRHWGNWGFLVDNRTNRPLRLHDLMDFNRAFHAYDTIEGANCQTVLPRRMTQKEAAMQAVRENGLHQTAEVKKDWFRGRDALYDMFMKRLSALCGNRLTC